MPEGDAVYRTARRLDAGLAGRLLARTDFRVPAHATADLRGRSVLGTDTHGKHLLTRVEGGTTLHTHLRMDGRWKVLAPGRRVARREQPDVRVLLETAEGATAAALLMPVVELLPTADEHRVVGHLGPDPLRADWDAAEAVRRLSADPRRGLAAALLDQRLIAGLGNLWVNELCFLRGHSPWTPVSEVDLPRTVDLAARMLRHSVEHSGGIVTTGDTRRGEQQWVAGRGGRPCRRCGTTVREVAAVAGDAARRRTCWCPTCQPGPGPDR
jgi:formamidopyrimidine-DNA glycosylase